MTTQRVWSSPSLVRWLVAATSLLFGVAPAFADQFYFVRTRANASGEAGLFRWDDATGVQSQVGGDGAVYLHHATDGNMLVLGLAASSSGTLYGFALDDEATPGFLPFTTPSCSTTTNRSRLVTIDTTTAEITYVGPWLSGKFFVGAAFDGQGRLFAVDCRGRETWQIDPATGTTILPGKAFLSTTPMDANTAIDFGANGLAVIRVGPGTFESLNVDSNTIASLSVAATSQGFDSFGYAGFAFTTQLGSRSGDTAASECRMNVLDEAGNDELGHINDPFVANPQQAIRDALQYNPSGVVFDAGVGSLTRANGPALPNCFYDWGAAPDTYHSSRAANGARHHIIAGGPYLGTGLPLFDVDSSTLGVEVDRDGVQNLRPVRGMARQFQIAAGNVGPNTRVQMWIDWDADGSFDQPGDQVLADAIVTNGVNTFTMTQPVTSPIGNTWARVRIANQSGLGTTGLAADGEVEDYQIPLTLPVDIGVTVTDNNEVYHPGTNVTYTITYTNYGPNDISSGDVRARDLPPAGTTASGSWSCVGVNGGTCNPATGTGAPSGTFPFSGTVARFLLPVGGSVVYTFTIAVPANFSGNLVNKPVWVNFSSFVTDINPSNDTPSDTDVPDFADVAITQSGPSVATPGAAVVYTSTVTNNGPATATAVSVSDTPPPGLTFVSNAGDCATAFPCALGDLAAGASRTITTTYQLPPDYALPGPIVYTTTVTSTRTDPSAANNSASSSTAVTPPRADLQITKFVSGDAIAPGETFTYTFTVTNNGPSFATNVVATDPLPAHTTFVSSAAGCTASGQNVTCPVIAAVAVGASATFSVVAQLDPAYTGDGSDILNRAFVTAASEDPALENNANPAGAPPVGPGRADVAIVKTVSSASVLPGETFSYTLLVSNQGPSVAANVVATDVLPAGVTFVSSAEGCTATPADATETVTCPAIATLNPGASQSFTFLVRLDPAYTGDGTDLPNRGVVSADTDDPVPANNTSAAVFPTVGAASADLSATKVAIGNAVSPGMLITYRITVANAGPSAAKNIVVTDTLPAPMSFISSPHACSAVSQVVTCTQATVLPGTPAVFDLLVRLDPAYVGDGSDLVNTATVATTTPDPDPTNDQPSPAPAPPIGTGQADVTITKTGPYGPVPAGGEITYTLVVTNQGPNAAADVVVQDPTPAGLTFIDTTGACTTAFPCALGTMLPGESKTFTARYSIDPTVTGIVFNTATVTSSTPDPSPANSTATAQTPPPPITYYLAEGATGTFFTEDVQIANPHDAAAPVTMRFLKESGDVVTKTLTIAAKSHVTVRVDDLPGLEATSASAQITSEDGLPLAVQRTMTWDASGYGGHTETAVTQPSMRWYFAEGAQGWFDTYVLLANPGDIATHATLTFLREGDVPVTTTVSIAAHARLTVSAGDIPELAGRTCGLVINATQPIVAERAMYFGTTAGRLWSGGHASAGAIEPALRWFYAEGATGSFFDTFILLSNPQPVDAHVTLEYLLPDGTVIPVPKVVPAQGRLSVSIDAEADERLHATAVSTRVRSDVPIVTERSMYWATKPDVLPWGEGHNSLGLEQAATRWAVADGRSGGASKAHTYLLLSNPWTTAAEVTVTYVRENGAAPIVKTYSVPPTTRYTVDVSAAVPELHDETFGARIEVTNGLTISVEQSLYWSTNDVFWAAGTNAAATRLP